MKEYLGRVISDSGRSEESTDPWFRSTSEDDLGGEKGTVKSMEKRSKYLGLVVLLGAVFTGSVVVCEEGSLIAFVETIDEDDPRYLGEVACLPGKPQRL